MANVITCVMALFLSFSYKMFNPDSRELITIVLPKPYSSIALPKDKVVCPKIYSRKLSSEVIPTKKYIAREKSKIHTISTAFHASSGSNQEDEKAKIENMSLYLDQGAIELCLNKLILTSEDIEMAAKTLSYNSYLKLTWKLLNFNESSSPNIKMEAGTVELGLTYYYKVNLDNSFINYASNESLIVSLIGLETTTVIPLAKTEISLISLLDWPNEKVSNEVYIFDEGEADIFDDESAIKFYGKLDYSIRLICSEEHGSHLKSREAPASILSKRDRKKSYGKTKMSHFFIDSSHHQNIIHNNESSKDIETITTLISEDDSSSSDTDSDIEKLEDALKLILVRNKALRITQTDVTAEMRERAKWLHEEYDWKRNLQEFRILEGDDPYEVIWRHWRNPSTIDLQLRRYFSAKQIFTNNLTITVEAFHFNYTKIPWLYYPKIERIYLFSKYLDSDVEEQEKTDSFPLVDDVSKPAEFGSKKIVRFDYKRTIVLKDNYQELLRKIINNEPFVITVMVKPIEDLMTKIRCCFQLGICKFSLLPLLHATNDKITFDADVEKLLENDNLVIGTLTITMEGSLALRAALLNVLTPPGLKVSGDRLDPKEENEEEEKDE